MLTEAPDAEQTQQKQEQEEHGLDKSMGKEKRKSSEHTTWNNTFDEAVWVSCSSL